MGLFKITESNNLLIGNSLQLTKTALPERFDNSMLSK